MVGAREYEDVRTVRRESLRVSSRYYCFVSLLARESNCVRDTWEAAQSLAYLSSFRWPNLQYEILWD